MEPQKEQPKVRTGEDRSIRLDKESIQYNNQDMDQHQRVDVNPSQLNTQNLNIFIRNNNDLSGRITGSHVWKAQPSGSPMRKSFFISAPNANPRYIKPVRMPTEISGSRIFPRFLYHMLEV